MSMVIGQDYLCLGGKGKGKEKGEMLGVNSESFPRQTESRKGNTSFSPSWC